MTNTMTNTKTAAPPDTRTAIAVRSAIDRRSFCTLATTSPATGRPHAVGILYQSIDGVLYMHMNRDSKKARDIAANPHVAVCVPVRRVPFFPPSTAHFTGTAELLANDAPELAEHLAAGRLKKIAGRGALDEPDGCFARVTPTGPVFTFGLGMPLVQFVKDPIHAAGRVEWER